MIKILHKEHKDYTSLTYNPGLKKAILKCRNRNIEILGDKRVSTDRLLSSTYKVDHCKHIHDTNVDCFKCFKNGKQQFIDFVEVKDLEDSKLNLLRRRRFNKNNNVRKDEPNEV